MTYSSVVISAGHSKHVRGAAGPTPWGLDEVNEARKVMDRVAQELKSRGVTVITYADDVSTTQNENLNRIVDFHNSKNRELDVSVHFNASKVTANPVGTEVWFVSQEKLAAQLSAAMAGSGLKDRGAKYSSSLFFLNGTAMPSVLLEVCFCDSEQDCKIYRDKFDQICASIANVLGGGDLVSVPPSAEGPPPPGEVLFQVTGRCSHFGGPDDTGVSADEGLAFIYDVMDAPHLFLPYQPEATTGLARRLNSVAVNYLAVRWDYSKTPKPSLLEHTALVRAAKTGLSARAFPADWGPHEEKTGRAADLSPCLMDALGITTDDEVTVIYPHPEGQT